MDSRFGLWRLSWYASVGPDVTKPAIRQGISKRIRASRRLIAVVGGEIIQLFLLYVKSVVLDFCLCTMILTKGDPIGPCTPRHHLRLVGEQRGISDNAIEQPSRPSFALLLTAYSSSPTHFHTLYDARNHRLSIQLSQPDSLQQTDCRP